jgi:hypothetical protein
MQNPCPRSVGFPVIARPNRPPDRPDDGACDFCGSLDPGMFMARCEAGDVKLVPTDKSYKVYIHNDGGQPFKQTYGETYKEKEPCGHEVEKHRWVCREVQETKFYFDHLSEEQMKRFVELLNGKKLKLDYPGHFYRLPFFIKAGE